MRCQSHRKRESLHHVNRPRNFAYSTALLTAFGSRSRWLLAPDHSETAGKCMRVPVCSRYSSVNSKRSIMPFAARVFALARFALWIQLARSHASFHSMRRIEDCDSNLVLDRAPMPAVIQTPPPPPEPPPQGAYWPLASRDLQHSW
jgi:hypothetical protein